VADNDRDLLIGVSAALARDDYDVSQAVNGFQALQMARELGPELMVVDEDLQGIGGLELCERMRADPQTRDIRLVLISSRPDSASGAKADLCLAKPADCREVARAVEELMG
jgi:CheY-like chemotaxis protein